MHKLLGRDVQVVNLSNPTLTPMGHFMEIDDKGNGIYLGPLQNPENIEANFNGIEILTWIPNRTIDMLCELKPMKQDAAKDTTNTS